MFLGNQVENEIEAYLLGYIYADGCISQYQSNKFRQLSFGISNKDIKFLQKIADIFNQYLDKNYIIKYIDKTNSIKLTICDSEIIGNLVKLGIAHRKTYDNNSFVFDNVPKELKWHFIRGYFDGDGSICFRSADRRCCVGFVSLNNILLNSISNFINEYFEIQFTKVRLDGKYSRINFGGNVKCKKFLDVLYKDATLYLERKYILYKNIPIYKKRNKYKGVHWYKKNKKWGVSIYIKSIKKKIFLGLFKTIKECIDKYNEMAVLNNQPTQNYEGEIQYE